MSDRLPYEEQLKQQLNELPLPDENMAWEDMKRRLEEDDDDGIILIWLRGCGLWGLLLVVLVVIGWWLFWQPKHENKKETAVIQREAGSRKKEEEKKDSAGLTVDEPAERSKDDHPPGTEKNENAFVAVDKASQKDKSISKDGNKVLTGKTNSVVIDTETKKLYSNLKISEPSRRKKEKRKKNNSDTAGVFLEAELKDKTNNPMQPVKKINPDIRVKDSPDSLLSETIIADSTILHVKDFIKKKPAEETVKDNTPKKDSSKQSSISFSAGIALHQLLPVDGQKLTPYNSQGRKGSLADYIPSLFFRMYRNDKWFIQSEFRYGAPQNNRELFYQQKSQLDTSGTRTTITSTKLKKTFYHQLPVLFNYFVLPNLSIGGGFVWNRFKSAISEQDVVRRNLLTGLDTVISQAVILSNQRADSNFIKTYFQALVEAQYRWKRFSLGARYSFGLQPYLKFTLTGGTQQKERNRALQVFIKYELWKSKAKR